MDKKKIIIISQAMEIGGAERALLGILHSFDYTKYQVDLFLMRHQGELMPFIPKSVNLLPEIPEYTCMAVPIADVLRKRKFRIAFGRFIGKYKAKKYIKKKNLKVNDVALEYSHKFTCKYMPEINSVDYDLAVSFLTPHYYTANKVKAKTKIAWIHTDYSYIDIDVDSELKIWSAYDYIASISDDCSAGFLKKFPQLKDRIVRIDNILSDDFIKAQSKVFEASDEMPKDGSVRLLSIGRFCNAKNFDSIPEICKIIRKSGLNVKWYLVGYGADEALIRSKIAEFGVEDYVIILGKKDNPYPYIKACDLYVQPSRYEGNCVSVHEAQTLGKPVVITNYATSSSQLTDGFDGIVVPMDNKGCAEGIVRVLSDSELLKTLSENTKKVDYSNSKEVEKLYEII